MKLFGAGSSEAKNAKDAIERKAQEELKGSLQERFGFIPTDEQTETFYNGNLMMVAAHLTQVCHPNGGTPTEIVNSYTQVIQQLMDWFNIVPMRERLDNMLEERINSPWAVPQQPVVPAYTPRFIKSKQGNGNCRDGTGKPPV